MRIKIRLFRQLIRNKLIIDYDHHHHRFFRNNKESLMIKVNQWWKRFSRNAAKKRQQQQQPEKQNGSNKEKMNVMDFFLFLFLPWSHKMSIIIHMSRSWFCFIFIFFLKRPLQYYGQNNNNIMVRTDKSFSSSW